MTLPDDERWMRRALALAARGVGHTSPNPAVGAVIVRDGVVLGEGYHRRAGAPHAEVEALQAAREAGHDVRGATIYVTLEPCCHQGRTGPCTQAILAAGLARVVFAQTDPNPIVAGRGLAELQAGGVTAEHGLLAAEARALNPAFNKWIATRRPFVTLKLAQSLDGRIARAPGERTAVTGAEVGARVMALRAAHDLVLVGTNTARVDDPQLTARGPDGVLLARQPRRAVLDAQLALSDLALYRSPGALVLTGASLDNPQAQGLADRGVTVLRVPTAHGRIALEPALAALGALPSPVTSILVEGGGALAAALLEAGLVDRLLLYVAPRVFGAGGVPAFAALPATALLSLTSVERLGGDLELTLEQSGVL